MAWRFLPLFRQIAERHPHLRLLIDHLGLVRSAKGDAAFVDLDTLLSLAKLPNVAVKATGAPGYSARLIRSAISMTGCIGSSMRMGRSGSSGART